MADSFEKLSRTLQAYNSDVPLSLCEHWIEKRFRQLLRKKDWSWALKEEEWSLPTDYSSTGVVTVPSDFRGFKVVVNETDGYRLRLHVSKAKLEEIDPERSASGKPLWVVDYQYSTTTGLPTYELWPSSATDVVTLKFVYYKIHPDFSDVQELPYWVDGDILLAGGKADLCRWPGTTEKPNPMYSVKSALDNENEFLEGINELMLLDEKFYVQSIWDEYVKYPTAPLDLRNHAVGLFGR